ncbi:MAG: hypothetical protein WBF67_00900, partial [Olleya sp.]
MKYKLEKGQHELFEKSNTIHYLRWLIIDDAKSVFFEGTDKNPKLVFSSNFDGSVEKHLEDLCGDFEHQLIDDIYSCCENYPEPSNRNLKSRTDYFKKIIIKVSAFYKGSPGRSLVQIRQEQDLRMYLRKKIDTENLDGQTAQQIHQQLKKEVKSEQRFEWLKETY